jgi:hypothetical protein
MIPLPMDVIAAFIAACPIQTPLFDWLETNRYRLSHLIYPTVNQHQLTRAAQSALAYMAIVHQIPKGIHATTWSQVSDLYTHDDAGQISIPANIYVYKQHPTWLSHKALIAHGFRRVRGMIIDRHTKHHIEYRKLSKSLDGLAAEMDWRDGRIKFFKVTENVTGLKRIAQGGPEIPPEIIGYTSEPSTT